MSDDPLFDAAVALVLAHEGGLHDDPDDPGGLTHWGFALRENPDLSEAALRAMTRDEAEARYRMRWWEPYPWRRLPRPVALKLFDLAVPQGPAHAIRALQRACRAAGRMVVEDGVLGAETIAAAAAVQPELLLASLKSELAARFRCIAASEPHQARFLAGWLTRAYG